MVEPVDEKEDKMDGVSRRLNLIKRNTEQEWERILSIQSDDSTGRESVWAE